MQTGTTFQPYSLDLLTYYLLSDFMFSVAKREMKQYDWVMVISSLTKTKNLFFFLLESKSNKVTTQWDTVWTVPPCPVVYSRKYFEYLLHVL